MGDAGGGDEVEHAVQEADAGAQDRGENELLARDLGGVQVASSGVSMETVSSGRSRVTS
jgi:hypothetical protein